MSVGYRRSGSAIWAIAANPASVHRTSSDRPWRSRMFRERTEPWDL